MRRAAKRMEEKEPQTHVFGDKEAISIRPLGGSAQEQLSYSTLKNRTNVMIKEATSEHYLNGVFN